MSSIIRPVKAAKLNFLLESHLPEAVWTFGGALRFDETLHIVTAQLNSVLPQRKPIRVAGCPACNWSLDWYRERRPMPLHVYADWLEKYAANNIGVLLTFDNPCISEDMLDDSYASALLNELVKRDRVHRNAVCVASDLLAAHIRSRYRKLPLICHPNRLIMEQSRRAPALYDKLTEQYDRVCLHPADASRPSIFTAITHPERFDIIINDSLPRNSALRREHLRVLADIRKAPYDMDLCRRRTALAERDNWHTVTKDTLRQKVSCNLTRTESAALYAAGYRSFIIQASQFRNEMTLLWDIFTCILDSRPDISNKTALIASSIMSAMGAPKGELPSGLKSFSFTNYE